MASRPAVSPRRVALIQPVNAPPASKNQAATALRQLAEGSRKEAGALRFEVLQRTTENNQRPKYYPLTAAGKKQHTNEHSHRTQHSPARANRINPRHREAHAAYHWAHRFASWPASNESVAESHWSGTVSPPGSRMVAR